MSQPVEPRVAVNIPTWRRKEQLKLLLVALLEQIGVAATEFEILVCDSGSGDGTKEMVEELSSSTPNVRFLDITTNTLAAKRNALASASRAPLLILLDDDCIPTPGFLKAHIALHEVRDGVVGCGAIRYPTPWVAASNYFRFRDSRHMGPDRPDIDLERVPGRNWTVMNMSIRAEDVARYGLMDESFVRYGGEDHEFAERWERNGVTGVFVPDALVWHHEWGGSVEQFERKHYFISRYGMPRLLELSPEYLLQSRIGLLEPPKSSAGRFERLRNFAVRIVTNALWTSAVRWWLKKTDHLRWAYSPLLYRYIAAGAYLRGVHDRLKPAEEGWF